MARPPVHGQWKSRTYKSWESAKQRCYYKSDIGYARYGGRGITMCDRWRNDFQAFRDDMGDRPQGMTLDRIDPDGPYSPDNCRWATASAQQRNRRDALPLTDLDAQRIRELRLGGALIKDIAAMFNISWMTAKRILNGTWRAGSGHVKREQRPFVIKGRRTAHDE